MIYCAEYALFGKRNILAYGLDEVFHIFSLRLVIHRARIVDDGQVLAFYRGFYIVFFKIYERADEGYARFVHIRRGREA